MGRKTEDNEVAMAPIMLCTKEVFNKIYPDSDGEEYREMMAPYNLYDYVADRFEECVSLTDLDENEAYENLLFRVVPLDEEYLRWIRRNHRPLAQAGHPDNLIEYSVSLSDEKIMELARKNQLGDTYIVSGIFINLKSEETLPAVPDWGISEEKRMVLLKQLEKTFGEGNVYLPGWISPYLDNIPEPMMVLAERYFKYNEFIQIPTSPLLLDDMKKSESVIMPFVVREKLQSPYLTMKTADEHDYYSQSLYNMWEFMTQVKKEGVKNFRRSLEGDLVNRFDEIMDGIKRNEWKPEDSDMAYVYTKECKEAIASMFPGVTSEVMAYTCPIDAQYAYMDAMDEIAEDGEEFLFEDDDMEDAEVESGERAGDNEEEDEENDNILPFTIQ